LVLSTCGCSVSEMVPDTSSNEANPLSNNLRLPASDYLPFGKTLSTRSTKSMHSISEEVPTISPTTASPQEGDCLESPGSQEAPKSTNSTLEFGDEGSGTISAHMKVPLSARSVGGRGRGLTPRGALDEDDGEGMPAMMKYNSIRSNFSDEGLPAMVKYSSMMTDFGEDGPHAMPTWQAGRRNSGIKLGRGDEDDVEGFHAAHTRHMNHLQVHAPARGSRRNSRVAKGSDEEEDEEELMFAKHASIVTDNGDEELPIMKHSSLVTDYGDDLIMKHSSLVTDYGDEEGHRVGRMPSQLNSHLAAMAKLLQDRAGALDSSASGGQPSSAVLDHRQKLDAGSTPGDSSPVSPTSPTSRTPMTINIQAANFASLSQWPVGAQAPPRQTAMNFPGQGPAQAQTPQAPQPPQPGMQHGLQRLQQGLQQGLPQGLLHGANAHGLPQSQPHSHAALRGNAPGRPAEELQSRTDASARGYPAVPLQALDPANPLVQGGQWAGMPPYMSGMMMPNQCSAAGMPGNLPSPCAFGAPRMSGAPGSMANPELDMLLAENMFQRQQLEHMKLAQLQQQQQLQLQQLRQQQMLQSFQTPVESAPVAKARPERPRTQGQERKPNNRRGQRERQTTVMLRNLPQGYGRDMLVDLMNRNGFCACFDFVYIPINFRSQAMFGYAFVNFVDETQALRARGTFEGFKDWGVETDKVCEVSWSDMHQGLMAHVNRYRSSPVMHESVPDEYKPAVYSHGRRVAFPAPTKRIRVPRIRRGPEGGQGDGEEGSEGEEDDGLAGVDAADMMG